MYDKQYNVKNLYVAILSRQSANQYYRGYTLMNLEYCVFLKECDNRYRRVLTDGIYSTSCQNSFNQLVVNNRTVVPITEMLPELAGKQQLSRTEIKNLEDNELATAFEKVEEFENVKSVDTGLYR